MKYRKVEYKATPDVFPNRNIGAAAARGFPLRAALSTKSVHLAKFHLLFKKGK
jgi:hypothetical protein